MPHLLEPASTGRAKCRGCDQTIPRGELRFGEKLPNPFADGEMTLWFHPLCAAYIRPEPLLETLAAASGEVPDRETWEQVAHRSLSHRRLPRIHGAERSPSSQAKCRSCREPIEKGAWRIKLVFFEEGRFSPGGFLHVDCHRAYFESEQGLDAVLHFSLNDEREDLMRAWRAEARPSAPDANPAEPGAPEAG